PGPDSDDADNTKPDSPITDAAATHSPEHECRCSIKRLAYACVTGRAYGNLRLIVKKLDQIVEIS
ncbi:hypothetical protein, partial [Nocardia seriolae]